MKTKIAILVVLALTSAAHANLIDLTPGGFSENKPPPIFIWLVTTQTQVAGANIDGKHVTWSPFEPLGPDNFGILVTGDTSAIVSWNLTGTNYGAQFVLVEGHNGIANVYQSDSWQNVIDRGPVANATTMQAIIFYGAEFTGGFGVLNGVSDTGQTFAMFAVALCVVALLGRKLDKRELRDVMFHEADHNRQALALSRIKGKPIRKRLSRR